MTDPDTRPDQTRERTESKSRCGGILKQKQLPGPENTQKKNE